MPEDIHPFHSRAAVGYPFLHALVHAAASETSADDEQVLLSRCEAIFLFPFCLHFRRCRDDDAPDRVAGHHDLVSRKESLHAFVGDTDLLHPVPEFPVGQPGETVLFLDEARDSHAGSRPEQRRAGITPHAHNHLRLELPEDFLGLEYAGDHFERHLDVVHDVFQAELPLQTHYWQTDNPVACRRHLLHLHLAFRADKEDFSLRIKLLEFVRDGNSREYVSSRAASAYHYS